MQTCREQHSQARERAKALGRVWAGLGPVRQDPAVRVKLWMRPSEAGVPRDRLEGVSGGISWLGATQSCTSCHPSHSFPSYLRGCTRH